MSTATADCRLPIANWADRKSKIENRKSGMPGRSPGGSPLRGMSLNILAIVVVLLGLGVVMAGSTGPALNAGMMRYRVFKHTLWVAFSVIALFATYSIDYHKLRRLSFALLVVAIGLLVGVLFVGARINGATRWYRIGGSLSFQPSEFLKLALCLYMADFLSREQERVRTFFKGFLQPVLIMSVAFILILRQPDFGTALLIAVVTFAMLFVAGIRIIHVMPALVASVPLLVYIVTDVPYRVQRILTFLDPWADPQGSGYQVVQSLLALGSGGPFGRGLGNSMQKLFYLPEAGNDFVFAILGEELGFVGCAGVLLLYALLFWFGMRVALRAPDRCGSLLAFGLTLIIGLQAVVNVAVVTSSAPTKGIALPLVSAGGSALVATMAAIGLILNVASHIDTDPEPPILGATKL